VANPAKTVTLGPFVLRAQADGLFNANDIAQRVENMYLLEESTLHSIWGPTAYVPIRAGDDAGTRPTSKTQPVGMGGGDPISNSTPRYGFTQHGIFHCLLRQGARDVLLLHTGDELWEFIGWNRRWRRIISDPAGGYGTQGELPDSYVADFPTQFEATGNGVVIVPQDGRAYFYDGECIAPLGFTEIPPPPLGRGPDSTEGNLNEDHYTGINDRGYAHRSSTRTSIIRIGGKNEVNDQISRDSDTSMSRGFGQCRIGTITTMPVSDPEKLKTANTGWVENGEWRCAVQYVDKWGNLSPMSPPSNSVTIDQMPSLRRVNNFFAEKGVSGGDNKKKKKDDVETSSEKMVHPAAPEKVRFQLQWSGISTGPAHCLGRMLYRTKDSKNTGDNSLYMLTQDALATSTGFATLPDNVVTMYPDNIPDTWLGTKAQKIVPVPRFRLARMALGRLWIGNFEDAPGTIRPSEPGYWGTFLSGLDITPDPQGEITGMWPVKDGLLVCTATSSFIVRASDDGKGFRHSPLSATIGCAAPNSMSTLPDGTVLWLSYEGFYSYNGTELTFASPQLRRTFKRATVNRLVQAVAAYDPRSREYRCWLSLDGNRRNATCFTFDKNGWRTRTEMVADSVCVTRDHRQYTLVGGGLVGDGGHGGVYLLDHAASPDIQALGHVKNREALVETAWLEATDSDKAKTSYVVYLWLRETESTSVTIEVLKNWREEVIETNTTKRYSEKDIPDFWASTKFGSGTWRDKRPFWTRAAVHVPSAESVKFRIRGIGAWEFVGLQVKMAPRYYGGAQVTP
tara:strand:- start:158 stop:2536 length:2379 start_codon:yes stop_codon:yes gene_type:complete